MNLLMDARKYLVHEQLSLLLTTFVVVYSSTQFEAGKEIC